MRKGFDGLCGLVRSELGRNPTDGGVYIFINRSRNQARLLHWERGGLVMYQKRLEKGTFSLPDPGSGKLEISWAELVLLIEGIRYSSLKKNKRSEQIKSLSTIVNSGFFRIFT